MLVLVAAQEQEWDEVHMAVKQFQNVNLALSMHRSRSWPRRREWLWGADANQLARGAHSGSGGGVYRFGGNRGRVDSGRRRFERNADPRERARRSGEDLDLFHALRPIFEPLPWPGGNQRGGVARLGFLRREDGVSMNRDRLVADAKEVALALVRGGYNHRPANWQEGTQTTQVKVLGEQFLATAKMGFISWCAADTRRNTMRT